MSIYDNNHSYRPSVSRCCLADDHVPPKEKRAIREYRQEHAITPEQHEVALSALGWTLQEYEDGAKHSTMEAGPVSRVAGVLSHLLSSGGTLAEGAVRPGGG